MMQEPIDTSKYNSSGDIEGYGYLTPLLAIASSKIYWLPGVATVADADATTATAITDGGDAVWYMNPTALLMNDVAVAVLTESVPMLLLATAKIYLYTSKCYQ